MVTCLRAPRNEPGSCCLSAQGSLPSFKEDLWAPRVAAWRPGWEAAAATPHGAPSPGRQAERHPGTSQGWQGGGTALSIWFPHGPLPPQPRQAPQGPRAPSPVTPKLTVWSLHRTLRASHRAASRKLSLAPGPGWHGRLPTSRVMVWNLTSLPERQDHSRGGRAMSHAQASPHRVSDTQRAPKALRRRNAEEEPQADTCREWRGTLCRSGHSSLIPGTSLQEPPWGRCDGVPCPRRAWRAYDANIYTTTMEALSLEKKPRVRSISGCGGRASPRTGRNARYRCAQGSRGGRTGGRPHRPGLCGLMLMVQGPLGCSRGLFPSGLCSVPRSKSKCTAH